MRRLFAVFGSSAVDPRLTFETARLVIRPPRIEDFEAWANLRASSRAFLEPWEPLWPQDDLTLGAYRKRINRIEEEAAADLAYSFFLVRRDDGRLAGGANLNNVRRRAAQMATLGYWMGESFAGNGLMSEAVAALVPLAFRLLKLERIEAACIPENLASVRVLEKTGFSREGLAREYLAIAGQRRDHLLFSRLPRDRAPEFSSPSSPQIVR